MKKIPVASIEDSMVVARDICGSNGNILITKGTPLSAAMGRRLESWGVSSVYVEGEEETTEEADIERESPEELKNHLIEKFISVIDKPLMKKIFNAVFEYRRSKS